MNRARISLSGASNYCQSAPIELPVGRTIGALPEYGARFGQSAFLCVLERYRPPHLLPHRHAVVMHASVDDLDNSGGGEWLYELQVAPDSPVQRHDVHWANEIAVLSVAEATGAEAALIRSAAEKYWIGVASDEPVWEYLARQAMIVAVHRY